MGSDRTVQSETPFRAICSTHMSLKGSVLGRSFCGRLGNSDPSWTDRAHVGNAAAMGYSARAARQRSPGLALAGRSSPGIQGPPSVTVTAGAPAESLSEHTKRGGRHTTAKIPRSRRHCESDTCDRRHGCSSRQQGSSVWSRSLRWLSRSTEFSEIVDRALGAGLEAVNYARPPHKLSPRGRARYCHAN